MGHESSKQYGGPRYAPGLPFPPGADHPYPDGPPYPPPYPPHDPRDPGYGPGGPGRGPMAPPPYDSPAFQQRGAGDQMLYRQFGPYNPPPPPPPPMKPHSSDYGPYSRERFNVPDRWMDAEDRHIPRGRDDHYSYAPRPQSKFAPSSRTVSGYLEYDTATPTYRDEYLRSGSLPAPAYRDEYLPDRSLGDIYSRGSPKYIAAADYRAPAEYRAPTYLAPSAGFEASQGLRRYSYQDYDTAQHVSAPTYTRLGTSRLPQTYTRLEPPAHVAPTYTRSAGVQEFGSPYKQGRYAATYTRSAYPSGSRSRSIYGQGTVEAPFTAYDGEVAQELSYGGIITQGVPQGIATQPEPYVVQAQGYPGVSWGAAGGSQVQGPGAVYTGASSVNVGASYLNAGALTAEPSYANALGAPMAMQPFAAQANLAGYAGSVGFGAGLPNFTGDAGLGFGPINPALGLGLPNYVGDQSFGVGGLSYGAGSFVGAPSFPAPAMNQLNGPGFNFAAMNPIGGFGNADVASFGASAPLPSGWPVDANLLGQSAPIDYGPPQVAGAPVAPTSGAAAPTAPKTTPAPAPPTAPAPSTAPKTQPL